MCAKKRVTIARWTSLETARKLKLTLHDEYRTSPRNRFIVACAIRQAKWG